MNNVGAVFSCNKLKDISQRNKSYLSWSLVIEISRGIGTGWRIVARGHVWEWNRNWILDGVEQLDDNIWYIAEGQLSSICCTKSRPDAQSIEHQWLSTVRRWHDKVRIDGIVTQIRVSCTSMTRFHFIFTTERIQCLSIFAQRVVDTQLYGKDKLMKWLLFLELLFTYTHGRNYRITCKITRRNNKTISMEFNLEKHISE